MSSGATSPDAVLLGGSHRSALSFVRSLGRRGLSVWVVDSDTDTIAARSRFCARELLCPSPADDCDAFVDFVADLSHRYPDAVFVPILELTLVPLHRHRERMAGHWALPTEEAVRTFFDKGKTQALADSLGIPVPPSWTSEEIARQPRGSYTIPVPAVVKPVRTVYWGAGSGRYHKVVHARDRQDLERIIDEFGDEPFVVQRYFEGVGVGVFGLFDHGKPLMLFQHSRIRDVNPTGSGSSYRRSVPLDPEMTEYACKLLGALDWHGLAMVEFRVALDGTPYLIEVNGRPWGSIQLAVLAGVDFPYGLYRLARGESVQPCRDYRTDIYARWLVGDLMHLLAVLRGPPAGWEGAYPGRLSTLARMAIPYRPGLRFDHLSLSDMRPAVGELSEFISEELVAPVRRRLRRRRGGGEQRPVAALEPPRNRGIEVALIGLDGCGKSTLARNLEERFPVPVVTLYMGHKDFVTYPMRWVAGRKRAARGRHLDGTLDKLPNRYLVFAATHWEWLNRRLRGRLLAMRGYVVVYDRHIVERMRLDGGWKARLHNAVARLYAWPMDQTLLLDGSPDAFYARKPEWSRGELEDKESDLRAQLDYLDGHYVAIDAEHQGSEEVYAAAAEQILEAYRRRGGEVG